MNTGKEGPITPERARQVISDAMLEYAKAGKVSLLDVELLMRTVVRQDRPYMSQKEWMQRQEQWMPAAGEMTDERMLGRAEGQLMAYEMYLLRLTGMGLGLEKIIEMLGRDIKEHDMLVEYAREKCQRSAP